MRGELDRADRAFGPLLAELSLIQGGQERALSEREAEHAEQATKLAEAGALAESRKRDLAERGRSLSEARSDVERLTAELAQHEEATQAATTEARAEVERLTAELAQHEEATQAATTEARAEVERLTAELAQHEEATEAAASAARRERQQLSRKLAGQTEALSAAETESEKLRDEVDTLRRTLAKIESQLSLLELEKADFRAAIAALEDEADRTGEALRRREQEARRTVMLTEELRESLAAHEQAEADARAELGTALARLAEAEAALAELQARRIVRPRTKRRILSQLGSWLIRPRAGGWRLVREYRRLRSARTFDAEAYLAENPDVDTSGLDPLMHYVEHGIREGRAPGRARAAEPDAAAADPRSVPAELPERAPEHPAPADAQDDGAPLSGGGRVPTTVTPEPRPLRGIPATMRRLLLWPYTSRSAAEPTTAVVGADFSDFIVLLARQRSGTNALRWVLATHQDIACFSEVFSVLGRDSDELDFEGCAQRDANFFNFAARAAPQWSEPGITNHRQLFFDFLEYLRCFSPKRYSLIDVKYNTTHFLSEAWANNITSPFLFDLITEQQIKVINVTRKNYLRFTLSNQKAKATGDWHIWGKRAAEYRDRPTRIDCAGLLEEFRIRADEDEAIRRRFDGYPGYLSCEYRDLFGPDGKLSPSFRRSITQLLDLSDEWTSPETGGANAGGAPEPVFRKQSSLPLVETIENYHEVAQTLAGTEFEGFLDDEPQYRGS